METCKHCGRQITFNQDIKKWVTSKEYWKCDPDPDFPVRAHHPQREEWQQ